MNKENNDYLSKNQPEGEPDFDKINRLNTNLNTRSSPLPESVEEAAKRIIQKERGQPFHSEIECFKLGYQYHQTHHSAEVERLREALKGIGNSAVYMINHEHQTVINLGLINHILETVNLALSQDALKEK